MFLRKKPSVDDTAALKVRSIMESVLKVDEPYIYKGKWSWFKISLDDEPREITLVYPDLSLCIQVHEKNIDKDNSLESADPIYRSIQVLRKICSDTNLALIEVFKDSPLEEDRFISILSEMGIPIRKNTLDASIS
jgi:hypothetical protein